MSVQGLRRGCCVYYMFLLVGLKKRFLGVVVGLFRMVLEVAASSTLPHLKIRLVIRFKESEIHQRYSKFRYLPRFKDMLVLIRKHVIFTFCKTNAFMLFLKVCSFENLLEPNMKLLRCGVM